MLGERLQELRKDHNLSQKQLADKLNLSVHTISSYERNISEPNDEIKVRIAKLFNTTTDYLLGLTDISISLEHRDNILVIPRNISSDDRHFLNGLIDYLREKYKNIKH